MELVEGKEYWVKAKFLGELSKSPNDGPYIPERRYAFRVGNRETSLDFSLVDFEALEASPRKKKLMISLGSVWTETNSITFDPLKGYQHGSIITVVDYRDGRVTVDDHGMESEMSVRTLKEYYTCVN